MAEAQPSGAAAPQDGPAPARPWPKLKLFQAVMQPMIVYFAVAYLLGSVDGYKRALLCHVVANSLRVTERVGWPQFNTGFLRLVLSEDAFHNVMYGARHRPAPLAALRNIRRWHGRPGGARRVLG